MKVSEKAFSDIAKKKRLFGLFQITWLMVFKANWIFIQISAAFQTFDFFFFKQQFPLKCTILVEGKWERVCTLILCKDRKVYL